MNQMLSALCHGRLLRLPYGFKFDSEEAFDDDVIDFGHFRVLLDSLSYPYLYGSELDYVEDLSGAKFIIKNPNQDHMRMW